jgi:succinoglycan biosynthesis protein ExoV
MMLPLLPRFAEPGKSGETLFVPHHLSDPLCTWSRLCTRLGIAYQSPCDDAATVVRRIAAADRVIAESLHAAIVADAFGVPWQAVSISHAFNRGKWQDWALSLGFEALEVHRFFGALRDLKAVWKAVRKGVRGGRPAVLPAAAAAPVVPLYDTVVSRRVRPKPWLEPFALAELARARRRRFVLSDRRALARVQDRFGSVLAECRAAYGF